MGFPFKIRVFVGKVHAHAAAVVGENIAFDFDNLVFPADNLDFAVFPVNRKRAAYAFGPALFVINRRCNDIDIPTENRFHFGAFRNLLLIASAVA